MTYSQLSVEIEFKERTTNLKAFIFEEVKKIIEYPKLKRKNILNLFEFLFPLFPFPYLGSIISRFFWFVFEYSNQFVQE